MPVESDDRIDSQVMESPQSGDLRLSLATLKERAAARAVDLFGLGLLTLLVMPSLGDLPRGMLGIRLVLTISLLIDAAYEVILVGAWGQTFGKRMLGIRIVAYPNCGPVGYRRAMVRFLILAIVPLAIAAFARTAGDAYRRGVHDRAAGTVVVRSDA